MAKKQFWMGIDTETTINDRVADFAAIVHDRNGKIYAQCAVLIKGVFGVEPLFHNKEINTIWSSRNLSIRMDAYNRMLDSGARMLASNNAINTWLAKAQGKYNPTMYAYNLAFDQAKCRNTDIDLNGFSERFCLWAAAVGNICKTKAYKQFVLQNHLFNSPTPKRNMTFSTTAETVTAFLRGEYTDEPHTAAEDLIGYEIPTLVHILKKRDWKKKIVPYNWKDFQVKDHYVATK